MTGRYEEPETQHHFAAASPGAEEEANSTGETAGGDAPDYGGGFSEQEQSSRSGHYVEPRTDPDQPLPGAADAGQVPPAVPWTQQGSQSGPYPTQSGPHPPPSGPHAVPGVSEPHPVAGESSGPWYSGGQPYTPQAQPQPGQPQPGQVPPGYSTGPQPVGWQQQQQQHSVPSHQQLPGATGTSDQPFGQDLSSAQLLRQTKRPPQSGWRRAVYLVSGRTVNLGESPADLRRRELISRINQPLHGCYKIAMLSLKGGVGKTTATATLGSTFSSLRGDRVIAVDANPDRGTLSQKIPLETTATVRHLLRDSQRIRKYSDVRSYTSQGPSRLEILASEQDPAVSEAFSEDDYRRSVNLLEHFYNVVLTDCGTGLMHSAMKGVLDLADSLVIVSSSSIDGARSASATLDWLDAHGYGGLVARSVAVINSVRPGSGKVDVDKLAAHFESRCRAVSKIPFDAHLDEGAEVELDQLAAPTRLALLELAATVADDFPHALGRQRGQEG
ncbi:MinD-like ATPase involved in chromosome partitioning or flagellar assembly [Saccharopolyspora lacisalsi]|uniref:MinD-like ATPase involved in chromosome partitioning or flagellar assembly n=1 Tax=Halosaccharopolyspora lacisalsi TaxID=1000566 RepID=A0A839E5Z7_9PSEU|nr:MinD/ParA family protein [Halosaccharopolyspora lacisalsi]MBA8827147.1 MinD-like ATPase involved in chromosome partitioning or flagellar assembly [Halosaccharopolyspora lacisalsi]